MSERKGSTWKEILQTVAVLLGSVVVIAGWLYTDFQDREQDRREVRTNYLIENFRTLYFISNQGQSMTENQANVLNKAVGDINILGTSEQIKLARKFAEDMKSEEVADATCLLTSLRDELRKELGMKSLECQKLLLVKFKDKAKATSESKAAHADDIESRVCLPED